MNLVVVQPGRTIWGTPWLLIGASLAGYVLVLFTSPVFPFLLDGFRACRRHPRIWVWFGSFSGLYFVSQSLQRYQLGALPIGVADLLFWPGFYPASGSAAATKAWLPALDALAGLFQQAVVTFPASAVAALLFLLNWRNVRGTVLLAARKRLRRRWWAPLYAGLLLCAVAAVLKPIFSASIYVLNGFIGAIELLRLGSVLDAFSFQFEALFGMVIQVYAVLLVYVWTRGLSASMDRVFALAVKRSVFAVRWTGPLLLAWLLLVHLPLLASYAWIHIHTDFTKAVAQYADETARPLLDVILLLFSSVQLSLVFHNETLSQALRMHGAFVRAHWYRLFWFLLVAAVHFFFLEWLKNYLTTGFPENSVPERLTALVAAEVRSFLSGWFLAAWVCLYHADAEDTPEVAF
ncbi:MAG: hypothetical protein JO069_08875 [Verrucomicrobia bacterium]|nr:hypothetical protein [Verrucomicrobiota bacterium]